METTINEYLIVAIDGAGECYPVAYGCSFWHNECLHTIEKFGDSTYDCIVGANGTIMEDGHKLPILTLEDINSYFQAVHTKTMEMAIKSSGIGKLAIQRFVSVATYGHEQMTCTEHEHEGMYSAMLRLQNIPAQFACKSTEEFAKLIVKMGIDGLRYFINCPE